MDLGVEKETARLWRVYRTIYHMLHDRGFAVTQSELDLSLHDFVARFAPNQTPIDRKLLTILVQKRDNPTDHLFVFFSEDQNVGVKPIRTFVERMVEQSVFKAVIVIRNTITSSASKICQSMAPKYQIEQFMESELVVNITEHKLVPQHILLSDEEKQALLKKYHLKESQLPRIQINDPVIRYFGLKRGNVVKIVRPSETAGRYVTYRIVI